MRKGLRSKPLLLQTAKLLSVVLVVLNTSVAFSQKNDNCDQATQINIPNSGFALGIFNSDTININTATVQAGETFAPAILVAGQTQKSVWYKFNIPTSRSVKVTLTQNGTAIQKDDIGFTVYKTSSCLPVVAQIDKLTPIPQFGSSQNVCIPPGDYLVQISSKAAANGPIFIQVETALTTAAYDKPDQAYDFGTLAVGYKMAEYNVACQSIEDAGEVCTGLGAYQQYTKTSWHVFKTPAYFDYITLFLVQQTNGNQKFGFKIYQGDVRTNNYSTLPIVDDCDSLVTTFVPNVTFGGKKIFSCGQLNTNTTYSVQLFFKQDFQDNIRLTIFDNGVAPTQAPEPILSNIPSPSNALGVLPSSGAGITTTRTDYFACNSRHIVHPCLPSLPSNGISYGGWRYNLSTYFTFTLATTSSVTVNANSQWGNPFFRLFQQNVSDNCATLDPVNMIYQAVGSGGIACLAPGTYTLQVLGTDSARLNNSYGWNSFTGTGTSAGGFLSNLGQRLDLSINVKTLQTVNKYSLNIAGAYDTINKVAGVIQPFINGGTYQSARDTFGCGNTVLPLDATICTYPNQPPTTKASYHEFMVADSGMVEISNFRWSASSYPKQKLYKGDAGTLAQQQNVFIYPEKISGLTPYSLCYDSYLDKTCLVPGTYTDVMFGNDASIGLSSYSRYTFRVINTLHDSPANAEDMGTLPATGSVISSVDYFSCKNNAIAINGFQPCAVSGYVATKAIYHQFYLSTAATLNIINTSIDWGGGTRTDLGLMTLFSGKATDGVASLTVLPAPWQCFNSINTNGTCNVLQPGWYTLISYGAGRSYTDPITSNTYWRNYIGLGDRITISINTACPGPQYNRPYKAAINNSTQQPFLIQWGPRAGHTTAYPKTDTTYTLPQENFNCTVDIPFSTNLTICNAAINKAAYYVLRTTQESYVQIDTKGYWGAVYQGNARTVDSALFGPATLIQPCLQQSGYIQICKLQPGDYTLVIFATNTQNCNNVVPTIYIDQVGYSRFDYANKSYDFGLIASDSAWHYGKAGDVNPLDAGRVPSNDFIYCTTGAQQTDPTGGECGTSYNSQIYAAGVNIPLYNNTTNATPQPWNNARRNLWYSFVVDKGGYVRVRVLSRTTGKATPYAFAVYKSNVDGSLPFSTVISSGQVDSTLTQGLSFIISNNNNNYCYTRPNEIVFYREPCSSVPERYYVVVFNSYYPFESPPGTKPNSQAEVGILLDSINQILPHFDHYSQASVIGTNLGPGIYTGTPDNYSCASRDLTDPVYMYENACATKTLWYKFTTNVTGHLKFRIVINNKTIYYGRNYISLYRELRPNDSTSNGLQLLNPTDTYVYENNTGWNIKCISSGTYYLLLPGCNVINENVYPQIQIIEEAGDFCSAPILANLNGAGTSVSSVLLDCHTIGTDYGEFNPTLTCPAGAVTNQYKTSWFRINIGGTDTLDVTTYLTENTDATSTQIKYRLMNGNCGAMQERSCVQDALTQDTYKCLAPGSYWVQVFSPIAATGTIDLHLSAIPHADACGPIPPCLANANFQSQLNCATDERVTFVNYSTFGSSVSYNWDFGYNGQTSAAVSPQFNYPALTVAHTYTVKLTVTNSTCAQGGTVIFSAPVTIPGRPNVNLGNDTTICTPGSSLQLNAATWTGSAYQWQNGSTNPVLNATASGTYWVNVSYNGCVKRDSIIVRINPVTRLVQTKYLCGNDSVLLNSARNQGELHSWNTGSVTPSIYAKTPGIYINTLTWNGCIIRDTFNVLNAVEPFANSDTTICYPFQSFSLNAVTPGAINYTWQNNSTASTYTVNSPGIYWVRVGNGTCFMYDTINVLVSTQPVNEISNASICSGQVYALPWGRMVNTAGVYKDTLRYATGCDSLIRNVTVTVNPKPNLGADKSVAICVGDAADLTAQYSTNGLTSNWTLNGAAVANPGSVNVPGIYRLIAGNGTGCSDTALVTVTIISKPNLGPDKTSSTCAGNSVDLTTQFITTGLTPSWTLNGTNVPDPAAVTVSGIYQLIVSTASGCSDTALIAVTVNPKPGLGADKTTAICPGNMADLTTEFNTTGFTSDWALGAAPVSTPAMVSAAGIYQLIASNNDGCSDTALVTLTFNTKPDLGIDKSAAICGGNSIDLNTQFTSTGLTREWSVNGTPFAVVSAITSPGTYQLIVTNGPGCKDTALVTLTINPKPDLGPDKTGSICPGDVADLTSVFSTTGLSSSWTFGGTPVSNPSSASINGVYQLIVKSSAGCNDTATVTLTTKAKPDLGPDKADTICAGSTIDLTIQFVAGGLNNSWTVNGVPVANPAAAGTAGIYQLITGNGAGCSDTALITVTISPKPNLGADKTTITCPGIPVDLSTGFSTTGLTSTWTLAGLPVNTPESVSMAGIYQLIAANSTGCPDTALVTISNNPKPDLGVNKSTAICGGNSVDLNTQFTSTGLTTEWSVNGTPLAVVSAITSPGIYQLIVTNSSGCKDTAIVTLTINPKPALGPDKTGSICPGEAADLTSVFSTTGLSSSWTFGGTPVSNPSSASINGVYQLIVKSSAGCNDTATVTLTTKAKPDLGPDKADTICAGSTIDLTIQFVAGGLSNSWTINGAPVPNPSAVPAAGVYQLITGNGTGCSDTALVTVTVNPKPNLGADKSVGTCAGSTIDITNVFATVGLNNSWTLNGVPVANPASIEVAGIYQLITGNSTGCADTALISVLIAPKPNFGNDKAFVICEGNVFDLRGQFDTTGLTAVWTIEGAAISIPSAVTQTGMYQLTGTNGDGCSDTAMLKLTVNTKPALGADKILSVCTGGSIDLTTMFNTAGLNTNWTVNGAPVTAPAAVTVSGIYQLIAVNNLNCADTALINLTVNPLPAIIVSDPVPVCAPAVVNITAASITAGSSTNLVYTYWQDAVASVRFQDAATAGSGLYYIKGTDANDCFDIAPVSVIVYPAPVVNAGKDTAVCDQDIAVLHGYATAGSIGGSISYLWSPADGLSDPKASVTTAKPAQTTLFKLAATVDYGICSITATDDVLVTRQPPVTAFAGNDTIAVLGMPHQLTASGGTSYLWSPPSPLNDAYTQNPLATLRQDTRFTVVVKDIAGCVGNASVFIKVYEGVTYYVPNAFSPNGDGINDVFRPTAVGIVSTDWFRIFNRYGAIVYETTNPSNGWDGTFKGQKQSVGNYIWSIKGKGRNGKVIEMKGNVVLVR